MPAFRQLYSPDLCLETSCSYWVKLFVYYNYSKPLLIRSNWGGGGQVIRISEAKGSPKRQKNLEHK
jgi:hypothetical protein